MIGRAEVDSCLDRVRALGRIHPLTDCHVHPFEAMYGGLSYRRGSEPEGIYSVGETRYLPPVTGAVDDRPPAPPPRGDSRFVSRLAMLGMRRIYSHTGPRCLADHMAVCGFSRSLLLPVLQPGEGEGGIEAMAEMFGGDDRFLLGYCVPNDVPVEGIGQILRRAVARFGVSVVKIHPNVTRLDLRTSPGRERVEAILSAAGAAGLPTVIHAGISPALEPAEAGLFGTLESVAGIDFGATATPVIIAHGGLLGHEAEEVRKSLLPRLHVLLSRHGHLSADISGLRLDVLRLLLEGTDPGRIVFGSDALYEPPWKTAVRLIHVLRELRGEADEEFVRIAGSNPERICPTRRQGPSRTSTRAS